MMILELVGSAFIFLTICFTLAWPLAASLEIAPNEKIVASVGLSIIGIFAIGWIVYICALPVQLLLVIPAVALINLCLGRRKLATALHDKNAWRLLVGQMIVTAWSVGWLGLVRFYSGGKWVGDWFGHWQRSRFFLLRWPRDIQFNGFDPLPSRPPLSNIVTGTFMQLSQDDFAHYQLASTILSSLAFLPAALMAHRFETRGPKPESPSWSSLGVNLLVPLFMLNPMFVENATYAWTKLPAAFFCLTAIYFFLRNNDLDAPAAAAPLCGAALGAALLSHYSAGPYAVLLVIAWFLIGREKLWNSSWRRSTVAAALCGASILASWFAWAIAVYGVRGTFLSNTTITDQASSVAVQLHVIWLNFRDTFVPTFLSSSALADFSQSSPWGWWRDRFFLMYQNNLLFAFGSSGLAGIIAAIFGCRGYTGKGQRAWVLWVFAVIALGVGTHGGRENSGLAHISLQPLVLIGLAFLAARWQWLGPAWRRILVAGITIDSALGIFLQFGTENHAFDRWFTPTRQFGEILGSYSEFSQMNSRVKTSAGWIFFGDRFGGSFPLLIAVLGTLLLLALIRVQRTQSERR